MWRCRFQGLGVLHNGFSTSVATSSGRAILFAGTTGSMRVDLYNVSSNTMHQLPEGLGQARTFNKVDVGTLGSLTFLLGGEPTLTKYVDVYDETSQNWIRFPNALASSMCCGAVATITARGLLFHCGGWTGGVYGRANTCSMYTAATSTWVSSTFSSVGVSDPAAASFNERYVLVAGGFNYPHRNSVHLYDADTNIWVTLSATIVMARTPCMVTIDSGVVFVLGGLYTGMLLPLLLI